VSTELKHWNRKKELRRRSAPQLAPVIHELQQRHYSMRGIAVELEKRSATRPEA